MKKNKRSQWMQGLLYAEDMYRRGYRPSLPFICPGLVCWMAQDKSCGIQNNIEDYEFGIGCIAYISHFQRLMQC